MVTSHLREHVVVVRQKLIPISFMCRIASQITGVSIKNLPREEKSFLQFFAKILVVSQVKFLQRNWVFLNRIRWVDSRVPVWDGEQNNLTLSSRTCISKSGKN